MKRPLCPVALVITAIVFIYLRISFTNYLYELPDRQDGETGLVTGVVARKEARPDQSGESLYVIYVVPQNISIGKMKYIMCSLKEGDVYVPSVGEHVKIRGKFTSFKKVRNPGGFDSRLYYATLKIAFKLYNAEITETDGREDVLRERLYDLKMLLEKNLDRNPVLSDDDSAVLKAMILGDKAFMDDDIKDMYKNSGIMHILAVSGLHISIIGMGLYKALRKCKIKPVFYTVIPIAVMYLYGEMCGVGSSSFRAICMFTIRLLAPFLGRTYDILSGLAIAEILLVLDCPLYLYNSGFLFSFCAVIGVTVVRPALEKLFEKRESGKLKFSGDDDNVFHKMNQAICSGLILGFSIMISTLPIYMSYYFTYPLFSLISNMIIIPLVSVLMVMGIFCLFTAGVPGTVPGIIAHLILLFYKGVCGVQINFPGNTLYIGHAGEIKITCYCMIAGLALFFTKGRIRNIHISSNMEKNIRRALIAIAVAVLIYSPKPELMISTLYVGQGDGIVIEDGSERILIDGGSTSEKKVGRYSIIPYLKYRAIGSLDAAIVTHEDNDHISGLFEIMDDMEKGGIRIKRLILPDVSEKSRGDNYRELEKRAAGLGIPVSYISTGEEITVGKSKFLCINPDKGMTTDGANAYSTVLLMSRGEFKALFTGDVEEEGQENIKETIRNNPQIFKNVTLLKVAHHGSKYTTDAEFLELINPKIAVISCGENNTYGHPHKETLERLENIGAEVYRTDESGAVIINVRDGVLETKKFLNEK
ncbi:DNA internalization-related competence protein ComEC/Rec2 [Butyrivibrio sp. AE2005]|uniref:DNA internalization-related competence protein ComEC/Rec2 n=1 Tax=Butyrivibrio sp. AE2005 TaxID=1496722 RepID=UPI0009DFD63F|nr:DNA internalization-related competence protein ComEC/Rec2 [Butyrivibrio sp. AE2005]